MKQNPTRQKKRKGIYRKWCPTHDTSYIGETNRSIEIRDKEHEKAAEKGQWSHSGVTQHREHCDAIIEEAEVIETLQNKNKNKLKYDLRIKEALYIKKYNCGPGYGMNEDWGAYVKTTAWTPVFNRI